jgi:hypothetical protein
MFSSLRDFLSTFRLPEVGEAELLFGPEIAHGCALAAAVGAAHHEFGLGGGARANHLRFDSPYGAGKRVIDGCIKHLGKVARKKA